MKKIMLFAFLIALSYCSFGQTKVDLSEVGLPITFNIPEDIEDVSLDSTVYSSFKNWKVKADPYRYEIRGETNKANYTPAQMVGIMKKQLSGKVSSSTNVTILKSDANSMIIKSQRKNSEFFTMSAVYFVIRKSKFYTITGTIQNGNLDQVSTMLSELKKMVWLP